MLTFFNGEILVEENKQLLKVLRKAYEVFSEECSDIFIECVDCPFRVRCQSENYNEEKWYE